MNLDEITQSFYCPIQNVEQKFIFNEIKMSLTHVNLIRCSGIKQKLYQIYKIFRFLQASFPNVQKNPWIDRYIKSIA